MSKYTRWNPETQSDIGYALIVAQNALTGYFNLSNGSDTDEHHKCAQHALGVVTRAIEAGNVLEQQGIVESRTR